MDLLKSWVIGALAWITVSLVVASLITTLTPEGLLGSFGGRFLIDYLPALVTLACVAGAAALLHPAPQRTRPARHAVAALTVPALSIAANVALIAADSPVHAETLAGNIVAGVLGAIAGWRLADRLHTYLARRDASRR